MEYLNFKALLEAFAEQFENNYKLDLQDKKASGQLINSISVRVNGSGDDYFVTVSLEDYWKYIEYGRQAGSKFPPINAIKEWIEQKPIIPQMHDSGKIPTLNSLAFLIARAISQNGIAPDNIFERTFDDVLSDFKSALEIALLDDVTNYLGLHLRYKGLTREIKII